MFQWTQTAKVSAVFLILLASEKKDKTSIFPLITKSFALQKQVEGIELSNKVNNEMNKNVIFFSVVARWTFLFETRQTTMPA